MPPPGTVICFMCKAIINYKKKDITKFEKHMNSHHNAYYGIEYLLAGCASDKKSFFAKEEASEKEDDATVESVNVTLEEKPAVQKSKQSTKYFPCLYCNKCFTVFDNMEEHVLRKHSNKPDATTRLAKLREENAVEDEEDVSDKENDVNKKMSRSELKKQTMPSAVKKKAGLENKIETKRKGPAAIAEPGQTAGNGKVCPLCNKEFRKKSFMRFHFQDIHQPGEFPCKGCGKMFTSNNKMSSHYSRHCNPNRKKRMTL